MASPAVADDGQKMLTLTRRAPTRTKEVDVKTRSPELAPVEPKESVMAYPRGNPTGDWGTGNVKPAFLPDVMDKYSDPKEAPRGRQGGGERSPRR